MDAENRDIIENLEDRLQQTHSFYHLMFMEMINLMLRSNVVKQSDVDFMMDRISIVGIESDLGQYGNLLIEMMRAHVTSDHRMKS